MTCFAICEPAQDLVPEEAFVDGLLVSGVAGEGAALLVEFVQSGFHEFNQGSAVQGEHVEGLGFDVGEEEVEVREGVGDAAHALSVARRWDRGAYFATGTGRRAAPSLLGSS